jgi:hypothetical protein
MAWLWRLSNWGPIQRPIAWSAARGATPTISGPVFPQRPELLGALAEDVAWAPPEKRHWTAGQIYHSMRGWLFPYIRSRVTSGDFHPLIAYLFTEFKCNLDCHYC